MTVLGLSFHAAVETLYVFVSINGSIYGNKYIQCFNRCMEGQSQNCH
ncbi:unnamed protein product [Staurois parvus]|uniref:Uncharacterized protein n=1 Tax=Staurois parvus TaxID=386267 RepID=A0ABN9AX00_9NEOB|nr:unnamed protein product [Staurois parvus]